MQGTPQEPGPKRVMVSKERGRTAQLRLEVPTLQVSPSATGRYSPVTSINAIGCGRL